MYYYYKVSIKTSIVQFKFEPKIFCSKNHERKIWLEKENQATCRKKTLEWENLGEKLKRSYQFPARLHC